MTISDALTLEAVRHESIGFNQEARNASAYQISAKSGNAWLNY